MKDKYIYPVIFELDNHNGKDYYSISFPDFPDIITEGNDLEDAITSAKEVIELEIIDAIENNKTIPNPTPILDIQNSPNTFVSPIIVNMIGLAKW